MTYKSVAFIAAGMLVLALAELPYGYYSVLRIVVSLSAIYGLVKAIESKSEVWVVVLAGIAILFNPVIKIYFARGVWAMLDIGAAILLIISVFAFKDAKSSTTSE